MSDRNRSAQTRNSPHREKEAPSTRGKFSMRSVVKWRWSMLLAASCLVPTERLVAQAKSTTALPGCWVFALAGDSTAGRSPTLTPPLARLTGEAARVGSGAVVRRLDARGRWLDSMERVVLSTWESTPDGDSIRVTFSRGFANSVYVLGWRRRDERERVDTLQGRAVEWFDYGPLLVPRGTARAIRSPCPADASDANDVLQLAANGGRRAALPSPRWL